MDETSCLLTGNPCLHRLDSDVQKSYSMVVSRGIATVVNGMQVSLAPAKQFDPARVEQIQEVLLEIVAGVVQTATGNRLNVDLGVNFMYFVKRGQPEFDEWKKRASQQSRSVYGRWLDDCPAFLLVGPATESARCFANFFVPVFDDVDHDRLFPGAPRAAVLGSSAVEELYSDFDWLWNHWPNRFRDQRDCCKILSDYLSARGFKYCISIPVLGMVERKKEVVGVVNVNTKVDAPTMTKQTKERVYEMLKPLLVLFGWTEAVRRVQSQATPLSARRPKHA